MYYLDDTLDMLDNKYGNGLKINIFTEDKLMKNLVYQAKLYGGLFREKVDGKTTEYVKEEGRNLFFQPKDLNAEYGALMCSNLKLIPIENEYEVQFVEENRSLILRSYARELAKNAGREDIIAMMDFNIFLNQTILYQTSAKTSGGAIGSLAKKFQSLVYIPNMLDELNGNLNYNTHTVKDEFNNYVFEESKFPKPVAVENNAMIYSNERQDSASHFTRIFRLIDLVDYFYEGDNSKERQYLLSNKNLFIELVLLHYNPDIVDLKGSHIFGVHEESNKVVQRFIPLTGIDFDKFNKMVHSDSEYDGYNFRVIERSYLDYIETQSYGMLKARNLISKLKGWEECL